jgi:hypothetical protein
MCLAEMLSAVRLPQDGGFVAKGAVHLRW